MATPAQLSGAGAASALSVLSAVAGAGVAVSPAAAQSVANALSSIALAPAAPSSSSSAAATSNFGAVLGILDSLASSQASALAVPGQAPATVSTPSIQMSVSLEDPASSRLLTAPLSAPGSASSFDPLPPAALAAGGGAPVAALFLSLAFDAHGGAGSNNTGGVTRLAFSSAAGAPLAVSGLATPILFSLPPSALADGQQAACSWWDAAASNYSPAGCASLPNPAPPGHELKFADGFRATSPASLATAWEISGPLLANCSVAFLDCTNATARLGTLVLDPASPASVSCGGATDVVLRAYVGATCALRNASGDADCAWDVVSQAFTGPGCVAANATRCACSHLTDFTSSPAPKLPVCSLSDLLSLKPGDLVTKLRLLFIVVCCLFGGMNVGAAFGYAMDQRERAAVAARLRHPACGFRVAHDGTWLWRFGLDPLQSEMDSPSGPAVQLATVLGVPFARLRVALPDEFFTTDLCAALGRRHGLSASGMQAAKVLHRTLLSAPKRAHKSAHVAAAPPDAVQQSPSRRDALRAEAGAACKTTGAALAEEAEAALHWDMDSTAALEEFVGTALVLAFLQCAQLLPMVELARRRAAAAAHFGDMTTPAPASRSFAETTKTFLTLLTPGNIDTREKWWVKARLWRLILSQSADGFWSPTGTVAFALEARSAEEVASLKPTWLERLKDRLRDVVETAEEVDEIDDVLHLFDGDAAQEDGAQQAPPKQPSLMRASVRLQNTAAAEVTDDPLRCSARALLAAMPRRLAALRRDADVPVDRVWTTLCCIALLERLNVCWLCTDGDAYPREERTMVDAAREWIEAQGALHPALGAALEDGALAVAAARAVTMWHRAWMARVNELRRSSPVREQQTLSQAHRACTEIVRAFCTKHDTCAIFLSEPLCGLQRWQMWTILVTLVINQVCAFSSGCHHMLWLRCVRCGAAGR